MSDKNIDSVIDRINQRFRKESKDSQPLIFRASEHPELLEPDFIETNIPELNEALGGGIPRKAVTVFSGDSGAGKTALALSCAASVQKKGGLVLYVNAEPPFPLALANLLGIDFDKLILIETKDYGEQIVDAIYDVLYDPETRTSKETVDLIIVDSINNLVPKRQVDRMEEKGSSSPDVGSRAMLLNSFTTSLAGRGMLRSGSAVILIAQLRVDINAYGAPSKPSGGKAVEFNPKVHVRLFPKQIKIDNKIVGQQVTFRVEKNSISGHKGIEGEYSIQYGVGVDDSNYLIKRAIEEGLIVKKGRSTYVINLEPVIEIPDGLPGLRNRFASDPELRKTVRQALEGQKGNDSPVTESGDIVPSKEEKESD